MADATVLPVRGASPYDVVVGSGLAGRLPGVLGPSVERVALLFPEGLEETAQPVLDVLVEQYDVLALGLPDGEQAKTAAVAADCWEALGERGFTRSDAVVTVGGGATTDLGGFVAATWLRGVRVVHVPDDVAGDGRRRGGRQDRHQHRPGQEPRRLLPRAGRRALRPRPPPNAAARRSRRRARRGREVRLHRRPRDPAPGRDDRARRAGGGLGGAARAHRAGDPGQDRRGRGRPARDGRHRRAPRPRGAQLRAHDGARDRAGVDVHRPARCRRRPRLRLRRRAGRPRRRARHPTWSTGTTPCSNGSVSRRRGPVPPSTTCSPRCEWTRRPAARC